MEATANEHYSTTLANALFYELGGFLAGSVFAGGWEKKEHARAPYKDCWSLGTSGITIFASEMLRHFCVEISGDGCEKCITAGTLLPLLEKVQERVTRIDVACDIETGTRPPEFVAEVGKKRMRSSGYQKSPQGETCYVGSKTSDRYARVYRYEPPHPRAHLLRVEHVFRRKCAKSVAAAIVRNGTEAVGESAGEVFSWRHYDWKGGGVGKVDISSVGVERGGGGTVFWLVTQCAPAFKRMVDTGVIKDPEAFIASHFLSS